MLTLGVDLASKPKKTAFCLIDWQRQRPRIEALGTKVNDSMLAGLVKGPAKVGIDAPFGWPSGFVATISAYSAGNPWPATSDHLRYRRTDLYVKEQVGITPLSVSTDWISHLTLRLAPLLSTWRANRAGSGKFVEVYPRAARRRWGLSGERSITEVGRRARWLDLGGHRSTLTANNHCFDALIAALVARASAVKLCDPIPTSERAAARSEGWIALPLEGSLTQLVG
jgi:predicted nuclease with RNAse H fold